MHILVQGHFYGICCNSCTTTLFCTQNNRTISVFFNFCLYIFQPVFQHNVIQVQQLLARWCYQYVGTTSKFSKLYTSGSQSVTRSINYGSYILYIVACDPVISFFTTITKISSVNIIKISAGSAARCHFFSTNHTSQNYRSHFIAVFFPSRQLSP